MSIPVFAVPILNRGDLLLRLFDSIGDFPIDKVVIVNNGRDSSVDNALEDLEKKYKDRLDVILPVDENGEFKPKEDKKKRINWGCSRSWNFVLKNYMKDYVWMSANDVAFRPGQLEKIHEWQEKDRKEHLGKLGTINFTNVGYGFWIMNETHLERCGYFDENFYPAYYEDMDYNRRMFLMDQECQRGTRKLNVSMRNIDPIVEMIHCNEKSEFNPSKIIDYESATIHSNSKLKEINDITFFQCNLPYYVLKWGGDRRKEKYVHPYGDDENDVNYWEIRPECKEEIDVWNEYLFGYGENKC